MVQFDGRPLAAIDDLHRLLTKARVGVSVPLTIIRRLDKLTLDVVSGESKPRG
jgi:hypothetical protein